ncbi:uncharacterized protein LOC144569195 [Carex rostrata]
MLGFLHYSCGSVFPGLGVAIASESPFLLNFNSVLPGLGTAIYSASPILLKLSDQGPCWPAQEASFKILGETLQARNSLQVGATSLSNVSLKIEAYNTGGVVKVLGGAIEVPSRKTRKPCPQLTGIMM